MSEYQTVAAGAAGCGRSFSTREWHQMFPDAYEEVGAAPVELTVIYDDGCPLCRRCRSWVLGQPHLVRFRFIAASEPFVEEWLGALVPVGDDLVVVDDRGSVWVGPDAVIVCLWGLVRYRSMAGTLQRRGARGLAKRAFHAVSAGRGAASLVLRDEDDRSVVAALARLDPEVGAGRVGESGGLDVAGDEWSERAKCDDRSCT